MNQFIAECYTVVPPSFLGDTFQSVEQIPEARESAAMHMLFSYAHMAKIKLNLLIRHKVDVQQ